MPGQDARNAPGLLVIVQMLRMLKFGYIASTNMRKKFPNYTCQFWFNLVETRISAFLIILGELSMRFWWQMRTILYCALMCVNMHYYGRVTCCLLILSSQSVAIRIFSIYLMVIPLHGFLPCI